MTPLKINYFKLATFCFILFYGMKLIGLMIDPTATVVQKLNFIKIGVVFAVFEVIFHFIKKKHEKKPWNELTFDEQCKILARDIRKGRRQWFLSPVLEEGDGSNAVPLSFSNMNEFGGGVHMPTTKEKVAKLLLDGKIKNPEMVNGVMTYLK